MLSTKIFSSSDVAGKYYSHGDYYGSEGEGTWFGDGAKDFNLSGKFAAKDHQQFYNLLEGITPTGERVGRTDKEGNIIHSPGVDLTFSVPKSFSLQMMLYAKHEERKAMEVAVMNSVQKTLSYIGKEGYVYARKGHNGKTREALTNLTFATFMHTTNRNLEPQVHVHSFLANIAKCSDGKYRSINLDHLLENNKLFGQMFRNELAHETKKLGFEITPTVMPDDSTSFELANVHLKLIDAFSTRRKEIVELCKQYGITSKEGRDKIVITSRKAKKHLTQEQLTKAWSEIEQKVQREIENERTIAKASAMQSQSHHNQDPVYETQANWLSKITSFLFSFGVQSSKSDKHETSEITAQIELSAKDLVKIAIEDISYSKSVFSESDLLKNALKYSIGLKETIGISEIKSEIKKLEKDGFLIRGEEHGLGKKHKDLLTTKELLHKEKQILNFAQNSIGKSKAIIKSEAVIYQCEKYEAREYSKNQNFKMNQGQRRAIKHILTSENKIIIMEGLPGVGKSTVLNAVRDISDRKVINLISRVAGNPFGLGEKFSGAAPTASAVKTLQSSAKVESQTLHSFLAKYSGYIAGRGTKESLKHFKNEYKNNVIFVDEASLISTNIMHQLLNLQEKFGFRLVLTGDTKQLGSVEAGKPFEQITNIIKPVKLTEIVRQKDQFHREAVIAASEGKIANTFDIHNQNIKTSAFIANDAASDYLNKTESQRDNTLLISPSRALRDEINQKIVESLKLGRLDSSKSTNAKLDFTALRPKDMSRSDLNFAHFYQPGDIVRFNAPYKALRINKGDYLKIKAINKITNSLILEKYGTDEPINKNHNIIFDLRHKTDYLNKFEVFQEKQLQLQEGLKIIFTKNNKDQGLINSETAIIEKISIGNADRNPQNFMLKFEDGKMRSIPAEQLKHIDYGYCITVHAAQGKTYDHTIAAISNNQTLNSQKMWLVAISRHRSEFTALVEDKQQLKTYLMRNQGREFSATALHAKSLQNSSSGLSTSSDPNTKSLQSNSNESSIPQNSQKNTQIKKGKEFQMEM
jgi:conjugative relaxase-like TrwC/TraI family protein